MNELVRRLLRPPVRRARRALRGVLGCPDPCPPPHDPRTPLELHLAGIVRDLDIQHVIDVGANAGYFGLQARHSLGFTGRIDSYEPSATTFAELQANAQGDTHWFLHRAALTDAPGSLTLNVFDSSDMSSLSAPRDLAKSVWPLWDQKACHGESVEGRRLESEDLPDLGAIFLKVDTQGHDWEVIQGAGAVLDRVKVIMIELSFIPLYESSKSAWQLLEALNELGFGLTFMSTISTADGEQRIIEADGVFVRAPRELCY